MERDWLTFGIAAWGAIVSTSVAAWNVYVWFRKGPRLRLSVSGPMISTDKQHKQKYITVRVANVGDAATTLNILTYRYFTSNPRRKVGTDKNAERGFFNLSANPLPLPHKLEVGEEWTYTLPVSDEILNKARNGYFFVEIEDSTTANAKHFTRNRFMPSGNSSSDKVPSSGVHV